jgi:hypothetical protein
MVQPRRRCPVPLESRGLARLAPMQPLEETRFHPTACTHPSSRHPGSSSEFGRSRRCSRRSWGYLPTDIGTPEPYVLRSRWPGCLEAPVDLARTADLAGGRSRAEPGRRSREQPNRVPEDRIFGTISTSCSPELQGMEHGRRTVMGGPEQIEGDEETVTPASGVRQVDGALPDQLGPLERSHHGRRRLLHFGRRPRRGDRRHRLGRVWRSPAGRLPRRASWQGGHSHQSGIAAAWRVGSPSNRPRQRPHRRDGGRVIADMTLLW